MQGRALGPHEVFIFLRALSFLTSVPGGGLASTEVSRLARSVIQKSFPNKKKRGRDRSKLGGWAGFAEPAGLGFQVRGEGERSQIKGFTLQPGRFLNKAVCGVLRTAAAGIFLWL